MNRKRNIKAAFTLIELLVVIAIIAILAAILFPVFAQAKTAAKQASSLSNVKQIMLGFLMYSNDYDDLLGDAEHGSGGHPNNTSDLTNWAATTYPYIKSGSTYTAGDGSLETQACNGIYQDVAAPSCSNAENPEGPAGAISSGAPLYQQGFSYGVNANAMPVNDYSDAYAGNGLTPSVPISNTQLNDPADKVILIAKGENYFQASNGGQYWNYPYFVVREYEYLGAGVTRVQPPNSGSAGWVGPDGDDSASTAYGTTLPDGFVPEAVYDSDCNANTNGAWECAAHPRYRYNSNTLAAFSDGHAKAVHKGSLQWFKNLYVDNPGLSTTYWNCWQFQFEENNQCSGQPGIE